MGLACTDVVMHRYVALMLTQIPTDDSGMKDGHGRLGLELGLGLGLVLLETVKAYHC